MDGDRGRVRGDCVDDGMKRGENLLFDLKSEYVIEQRSEEVAGNLLDYAGGYY